MLVTTIGHAGLRVETARATILIDPWQSPHGAFQASWFQFPSNQHLVSDSLLAPDVVVLSHEHLDHLDPWTLARVPPDVPVIVPRYPSPVLLTKIAAARERPVIELAAWERYEIAEGTSVFFVQET